MIEKFEGNTIEISNQIYSVFQLSHAVEAKLFGAIDFHHLKDPLKVI